jgi:hypothetical protein
MQRLEFGHYNTTRNFPEGERGEAPFVDALERAMTARVERWEAQFHSAVGREFALHGYGRADLLWVTLPTLDDSGVTLMAIEAKLKDWRKGFAQAFRYRYYANRSVLVLPPAAAERALKFVRDFEQSRVGLWEFDQTTGKIHEHFTPYSTEPLNMRARAKAVAALSAAEHGELLSIP